MNMKIFLFADMTEQLKLKKEFEDKVAEQTKIEILSKLGKKSKKSKSKK